MDVKTPLFHQWQSWSELFIRNSAVFVLVNFDKQLEILEILVHVHQYLSELADIREIVLNAFGFQVPFH